MPGMLGLTDNQLRVVMDAAATVSIEKRDLYLQRMAAMLTMATAQPRPELAP